MWSLWTMTLWEFHKGILVPVLYSPGKFPILCSGQRPSEHCWMHTFFSAWAQGACAMHKFSTSLGIWGSGVEFWLCHVVAWPWASTEALMWAPHLGCQVWYSGYIKDPSSSEILWMVGTFFLSSKKFMKDFSITIPSDLWFHFLWSYLFLFLDQGFSLLMLSSH